MTALIDPGKPWQRVRIECVLRVLSPLHVGDGHTQTFAQRNPEPGRAEVADETEIVPRRYSTVCRDHKGRAMLPASSLRGLLRAELARIDDRAATRLFGPMANGDALSMGVLVVHDAPIETAPQPSGNLANYVPFQGAGRRVGADTCIAQSVSIDPITGTAADHLLFSEEYVPVGSAFRLSFELGPCDDADVDTVLALLNACDGTHDISIGAGGSHGFGRFRIDVGKGVLKVKARSGSDIVAWLTCRTTDALGWHELDRRLPTSADLGRHRRSRCHIDLHFDSAFAVHDPGLVRRTGNGHSPQIEFTRDSDGSPRIPGRSLRGLLRHRANRIIATILHAEHGLDPNDAREWAGSLTHELFGSVYEQSPLRINDATLTTGAFSGRREQTFNAVDRFTGGVADQKLYTANLAQATSLGFDISIAPRTARTGLPEWWLGLGLLVLRDAVEGDLAVGWGKAKGLGAFRAALGGNRTWTGVLSALRKEHGDDTPEQWVRALHAHITHVVDDTEHATMGDTP